MLETIRHYGVDLWRPIVELIVIDNSRSRRKAHEMVLLRSRCEIRWVVHGRQLILRIKNLRLHIYLGRIHLVHLTPVNYLSKIGAVVSKALVRNHKAVLCKAFQNDPRLGGNKAYG
jgi:hypothetical protein